MVPSVLYWNYYAKLFPEEDAFERIMQLKDNRHADFEHALLASHMVRRWGSRILEYERVGLLGLILNRLFPKRRKKKA